MQEGAGKMERPSLPARLEHIEEQVKSLHQIADRMRPEEEKVEGRPTAQGIEEATARIEADLQQLIHRYAAIADTVGQL